MQTQTCYIDGFPNWSIRELPIHSNFWLVSWTNMSNRKINQQMMIMMMVVTDPLEQARISMIAYSKNFCVIGGSNHITANVTCWGVKESENIIWLTGSCPQCPLSVGTLSLLLAAKWHHTYLPAVILLVGYFLCCPSTEIGWGGCRQICQHLFGCFVLSLSGAIFSRYYLLNDTAIWYHWRYWK